MKQYKCLDEECEMDSEETEIKFLFDAVDDKSSSSSSSSSSKSSSSSDKKARRRWNLPLTQQVYILSHVMNHFAGQKKKKGKGKKKDKKETKKPAGKHESA